MRRRGIIYGFHCFGLDGSEESSGLAPCPEAGEQCGNGPTEICHLGRNPVKLDDLGFGMVPGLVTLTLTHIVYFLYVG